MNPKSLVTCNHCLYFEFVDEDDFDGKAFGNCNLDDSVVGGHHAGCHAFDGCFDEQGI